MYSQWLGPAIFRATLEPTECALHVVPVGRTLDAGRMPHLPPFFKGRSGTEGARRWHHIDGANSLRHDAAVQWCLDTPECPTVA